MQWKQIEDEPKTFVLIFETGDGIASVLQHFARKQGLAGSSFKAIALELLRARLNRLTLSTPRNSTYDLTRR
jgi:hypothetical protein